MGPGRVAVTMIVLHSTAETSRPLPNAAFAEVVAAAKVEGRGGAAKHGADTTRSN